MRRDCAVILGQLQSAEGFIRKMNRDQPVGIFDSGVGGLSVLRQIRADMPHENLLYVADSGYVPYGNKPTAFIIERALTISEFLLAEGAKAIVAACNTATAAAIHALRLRFQLPIIGIEPAVKPAVAMTRTGVVGVLATDNTIQSKKFTHLISRHEQQARFLVQPCPGLADCVEQGDLFGKEPRILLERYLAPLISAGIDTLVLGCTHYPFLSALIQEIAGANITIIDPSPAVSRQLRQRLISLDLISERLGVGNERYFTSGGLQTTAEVMGRLLDKTIYLESLPNAIHKLETVAPLSIGH